MAKNGGEKKTISGKIHGVGVAFKSFTIASILAYSCYCFPMCDLDLS